MSINQILRLHVRSLIRLGRVLAAKLDHTVVRAESKTAALHIHPLTELVIIVQTILAELQLDTRGCVLDVQALVDIAGLVLGNNLTADDDVLFNGKRRTFSVHLLELQNRSIRSHRDRLVNVSLAIISSENRLPLVAGCEQCQRGECCADYVKYLVHARI